MIRAPEAFALYWDPGTPLPVSINLLQTRLLCDGYAEVTWPTPTGSTLMAGDAVYWYRPVGDQALLYGAGFCLVPGGVARLEVLWIQEEPLVQVPMPQNRGESYSLSTREWQTWQHCLHASQGSWGASSGASGGEIFS